MVLLASRKLGTARSKSHLVALDPWRRDSGDTVVGGPYGLNRLGIKPDPKGPHIIPKRPIR